MVFERQRKKEGTARKLPTAITILLFLVGISCFRVFIDKKNQQFSIVNIKRMLMIVEGEEEKQTREQPQQAETPQFLINSNNKKSINDINITTTTTGNNNNNNDKTTFSSSPSSSLLLLSQRGEYFTPDGILYEMQKNPVIWRNFLSENKQPLSISNLKKATVEITNVFHSKKRKKIVRTKVLGCGISFKIDFFSNSNNNASNSNNNASKRIDNNNNNTISSTFNSSSSMMMTIPLLHHQPSQLSSQKDDQQQNQNTQTQQEGVGGGDTVSGYYKSVLTDLQHFDAESHLKEIKAYYLDTILGTNVVLPCVGYRLTGNDSIILNNNDNDDDNESSSIIVSSSSSNKEEEKEEEERFGGGPILQSSSSSSSKWGNEIKDFVKESFNDNKNPKYCHTNVTKYSQGSLMIWLDGITEISLKETLKAPFISVEQSKKKKKTTNDTTTNTTTSSSHDDDLHDETQQQPSSSSQQHHDIYKQSAISYAVFHYLGNCRKSDHNHFIYLNQKFIAIDNDRCLTRQSIQDKAPKAKKQRMIQWKQIVFDSRLTCYDYPTSILEMIQKQQHNHTNSSNSSTISISISQQLQNLLSKDVLSKQLLESEPDAFDEIDIRFQLLSKHIINKCRWGVGGGGVSVSGG